MFYEYTELVEGYLGADDLNGINSIMKNKYMNWDWNFGYSPEFNMRQGKRFSSGKIEVLINVKNGIIYGIKFYGDFFSSENPEEIETLLLGIRYEENEIRNTLAQYNIDDFFKGITLEELLSCIL
jgi:lipoate-protein ligase A